MGNKLLFISLAVSTCNIFRASGQLPVALDYRLRFRDIDAGKWGGSVVFIFANFFFSSCLKRFIKVEDIRRIFTRLNYSLKLFEIVYYL